MSLVVIPSPAKINLFLKIVGKRPDGYHVLESLMCRVGLFDTITLSFGQPRISVSCTHPKVPDGRTNVAYKATALFFEALSKHEGVAISIEKVIPVAAGLGGGSSNAATVLMGLNQYYGLPFTKRELMDMGLKVGADVPFFLFRHTAVARGIGEHLERFERMPPWSAALVCPKYEIATAWAYEHLNLQLTNRQENYNFRPVWEDLCEGKALLCNDLEQVTAKRVPEIHVIKRVLLDLGAKQALMSGSGPAVFGLFQGRQRALQAYRKLKQQRREDIFVANLLLP